jgi:hypothetical protein
MKHEHKKKKILIRIQWCAVRCLAYILNIQANGCHTDCVHSLLGKLIRNKHNNI